MNYVTTNLRFPKEEYESLKNLAFVQKRSIASIVREAINQYKSKKMSASLSERMKLFDQMVKSRIKIDISTTKLVKIGRKFE